MIDTKNRNKKRFNNCDIHVISSWIIANFYQTYHDNEEMKTLIDSVMNSSDNEPFEKVVFIQTITHELVEKMIEDIEEMKNVNASYREDIQ